MQTLTQDKPQFYKRALTHAGTPTTTPGQTRDWGSSEEEPTSSVETSTPRLRHVLSQLGAMLQGQESSWDMCMDRPVFT